MGNASALVRVIMFPKSPTHLDFCVDLFNFCVDLLGEKVNANFKKVNANSFTIRQFTIYALRLYFAVIAILRNFRSFTSLFK
jgi:hypothetical protein